MKLTIIVPVYNIQNYLPRFFDSIAAQTFQDYILLMIDDGSEDNSLEVCERYAANDARIKIIHLDHVGVTKARNIAMEHIETEYVVYADGDDYVDTDYLTHLIEAQEKYNTDLVISRVVYHLEKDNHIDGMFPERGETVIQRNDFNQLLPTIFEDRRLNYLYGKIYRTSFLKSIRVEDDVKQGSDTMINCQYIGKIDSIVLIDDPDYHYIKYSNRSVTSYSGNDAYLRICRINKYIYDSMANQGFLSQEMYRVIDGRVLQSAGWVIDRVLSSEMPESDKEQQISEIFENGMYQEAYGMTC